MTVIKKLVQFIRNKPLDMVLYLVFAIAIIKLYSLYFSVNVDDANWGKFSIENNCNLQKTEYGIQKASWKCDDGKVYYRWMHQK